MKRLWAVAAFLGFLVAPLGVRAQGYTYNDVALNSQGRPLAGINVSVCMLGLSTTGATAANGLATLTMSSSPQTAGFAAGSSFTVSGFTGGDTSFNGTFTILAVSSTTISYALSYSGTASSNGSAYQAATSSSACAPLATTYTDYTLSVALPNPLTTTGLGNYSFSVASGQYLVAAYGTGVSVSVTKSITAALNSGMLPLSVANGGTGTATATSYTVFGNCGGSTGPPSFCAITAAMLPFNLGTINTWSATNTYSAEVVMQGSPTALAVNVGVAAFNAGASASAYQTNTNCASGAAPAVCGSAAAGHVLIAAGGATTVVVDTTAVTANSEIIVMEDQSIGSLLGATCNTAHSAAVEFASARSPGTSFTITSSTTYTANPGCFDYWIVN